jgi:hypothetical protein
MVEYNKISVFISYEFGETMLRDLCFSGLIFPFYDFYSFSYSLIKTDLRLPS